MRNTKLYTQKKKKKSEFIGLSRTRHEHLHLHHINTIKQYLYKKPNHYVITEVATPNSTASAHQRITEKPCV